MATAKHSGTAAATIRPAEGLAHTAAEPLAEDRPVETSPLSHRFYLTQWKTAGFPGADGSHLAAAEQALRGVESIAQLLMANAAERAFAEDDPEAHPVLSRFDVEGLHCGLIALAAYAGDKLGAVRNLPAGARS